jgi:hypothetical protein
LQYSLLLLPKGSLALKFPRASVTYGKLLASQQPNPTRRCLGRWTLVAIFFPVSLATSAPTTLTVEALDTLPGFHLADVPRYLALHMADAHLVDWRFEPGGNNASAPDRVEWSFKSSPYAGGEVRSFTRPHLADRIVGVHRPITIEARLYLNGEYQTLVEQQAVIEGGPDDPDLSAAVASVTQNMLGPHGAYRAIDSGQHPVSRGR